jgi:leader peptidase (prepilin peptidase)/N-methyltransferase
MSPLAAVYCGLLGVPVGAFLNVVIERTPDRLPLRGVVDGEPNPPRAWLGVPVQPWILRGSTADDRRGRWLAVELATAAVFAALGAQFGRSSVVVPMLVLGAALVAISFVDLELLRIPDRITFPALGVAVVTMAVVSAQHHVTDALWGALAGSSVYFGLLLLAHLVSPRGMGFGDVKLALLMGLFLGWLGWTPDDTVGGPVRLVLQSLVLGCLLGVVFGLTHQVVTKRRGEFPFGPSLALGCLVVLLSAA